MLKRYVALDCDGVILRNHPVHTHVAQRAQAYVAKKLSIAPQLAANINRELYEATGHTLLGLQKMGVPAPLREYNEYVYSSIDYNALLHDLHITHAEDAANLAALLNTCDATDVTPIVFSNNPYNHNVEILTHLLKDYPQYRDKLCTVVNTYIANHLKPEREAYDALDRLYRPSHVTFVDDKMLNLVPAMGRPHWHSVLIQSSPPASASATITRDASPATIQLYDRLTIAPSLRQLACPACLVSSSHLQRMSATQSRI